MELQLPRTNRLVSGTATPIFIVDPNTGLPLLTVATPVRVGNASGVIRNSTNSLYGLVLLNTNAAARFLQLYNKSSAGVPGTDTPVVTIPLAPNGTFALNLTSVLTFSTGCSYAVTTDYAGTTAGAAGDIVGTALYV